MTKNLFLAAALLCLGASHASADISLVAGKASPISGDQIASTFTVNNKLGVGLGSSAICSTCTLQVVGSVSISSHIWVQQPGIRVKLSSSQNLKNGATTNIYFQSQDWARGGFSYVSGSSDTITVPGGASGIYRIECHFGLIAASVTGAREGDIFVNAASYGYTAIAANSATQQTAFSTADVVPLSVGDTVKCRAFQNSGGDLTISADANGRTTLSLIRMGN